MKKDPTIIDEINVSLCESWENKKARLQKPELEIMSLFESCSDMVMYYLRSVITFNVKKTSLA